MGCNWPSSWLSVTVEMRVSRWTRTLLWCWDAELAEVHLWQRTRGPRLATSASDIGTWGLRLATSGLRLERDLRVWEVRVWGFVCSNFLIAYRTPSKVFDIPRLTGTDFKILWTLIGSRLPVIELAFFWEAARAWSCLNSSLRECTIELLEASKKDHCNLIVGVLLNQWSCQLSLSVYCWTDYSSSDILFVLGGKRTQLSQTRFWHTDQVETRASPKLRCDSQL